jgi:hypothetical protein
LDELLPEADFAFDADGQMVNLTPIKLVGDRPTTATKTAVGSDTGASARVRQEHQEGQKIGNEVSARSVLTTSLGR